MAYGKYSGRDTNELREVVMGRRDLSILVMGPTLLLPLLLIVCSAQSPKDRADLSLDVQQERGSLILTVGLEMKKSATIYMHPRFGLEEQLEGYLKISFIDTHDRIFELSSGKPKTKYPHKKFVEEVPAGSIFEVSFEIKGDWPYSFTTSKNDRLYQLPPGEYRILVTYEVAEDAISKRLDMDAISASAVEAGIRIR